MKHLIIFALFSFFACSPNSAINTISRIDTVVLHDTVPVLIIKDTCAIRTDTVYVTVKSDNTDSLKAAIKTLNAKLFLSNYKIERVKYYISITVNNPSQTKFLKGWISRAIK